ncbi:hypothetical protein B4168_1522 [Anoxybacillus flavithermus]|nr:hypothetical protein B4168_1522 [Anoxybacillus flavithermus]
MKKKRIFSLLINKQCCFLIAYVRKMKRFSMQCLISDRHKSTPAFHLTESGGGLLCLSVFCSFNRF